MRRTIIPSARISFDGWYLTTPSGIFPKTVSLTSNVSKSFHKVDRTNQWHKILIETNLNASTKIFLNLLDPVYSQHIKHFCRDAIEILCAGLERQTFVGPEEIGLLVIFRIFGKNPILMWRSQKLKIIIYISFSTGFEVCLSIPPMSLFRREGTQQKIEFQKKFISTATTPLRGESQ